MQKSATQQRTQFNPVIRKGSLDIFHHFCVMLWHTLNVFGLAELLKCNGTVADGFTLTVMTPQNSLFFHFRGISVEINKNL